MRIKLRELGVQVITLHRLLSMGKREQTKILLEFFKNSGIVHRVWCRSGYKGMCVWVGVYEGGGLCIKSSVISTW